MNYNLGCIGAILFECLAPFGGIEDWIGVLFIFIFSGIFQKRQANVRNGIKKLEIEYEKKLDYKDDLYEELKVLRSLVNEKKREEDKTSYVGLSETQNIVYDNVVSLRKTLY